MIPKWEMDHLHLIFVSFEFILDYIWEKTDSYMSNLLHTESTSSLTKRWLTGGELSKILLKRDSSQGTSHFYRILAVGAFNSMDLSSRKGFT